jgi:hypothetical protein
MRVSDGRGFCLRRHNNETNAGKRDAPKGQKDSAWGFNPRYKSSPRTRPEGAADCAFQIWLDIGVRGPALPPLQAGTFFYRYQGLKPLAESYSPFGTNGLPTNFSLIWFGSVLVALNYLSGSLLKLFDRG